MADKIRKYLSYAVLITLIACVCGVILAKILVTPERVRHALIPVVEDALHCRVKLDAVDVNLYSGVTLTGLELLDRDDQSRLMATDGVKLRYQFWPLFQQRIVIDEIMLEKPQVNIERFADGGLNLQQLFGDKTGDNQAAHLLGEDSSDFDITITKIIVDQGEIVLKDYSFTTIPHRYKITDLGINVESFSLSNDFSFKLWGKVNGDPIDFDGTANLNQRSYDVQVNISHLNMVQFQPYYRQLFSGHLDGLQLTVDGRIVGDDEKMNAQGDMSIQQLDMTLASHSDIPVRLDTLGVKYDLNYDKKGDQLIVDRLKCFVDDVAIDCSGEIDNLHQRVDVDLHCQTEKLSLRSALAVLPPERSRTIKAYDPAGMLSAQLQLRGALNDGVGLLKSAKFSLDAVQFSVSDLRPALSGVVKINKKQLIAEQLSLDIGDNHMDVDLSCANWLAKKPLFRLQLSADNFTTFSLTQEHRSESAQRARGRHHDPGSSSRLLNEVSEPPAIQVPFDVGGDVVVKHAQLNLLELSDIRFHYELKNDVLTYDRLRARLAGGALTTNGKVDLSRQGYVYSGHVMLQNIDLDTLMPQLDARYADTLSGSLNTTFDYLGAGTLWLRLQQNLAGAGEFNISDGQMRGNAVLDELTSLLALPELQLFSFANGNGNFDLTTGGPLKYSAEFSGSKARLQPVGSWNFDGTITSDLDVYLAPELRAKLLENEKLSSFMHDDNGWFVLPLKLEGRADSPKLSINIEKVQKSVLEHGVDKLEVKMNKTLGSETQNVVTPAVQLLESTLKDFIK